MTHVTNSRGRTPGSPGVGRRAVLLGLAAGAVGATGLAGCDAARDAGRSAQDALGLGDLDVTDRTFASRAAGRDVTYRVVTARGHAETVRPVVYLHGLGGDHAGTLDRTALGAELLGPGTALVTVDGGSSYFHRRASGEDVGAMVTGELLPRLRDDAHLTLDRVGLAGFSMGGYGALLLAARWDAAALTTGSALAAVAVCDPALWTDPGDSAPGAFDDREDFLAHDVFAPAALAALRRVPVWITVGTQDPFRAATERMQSELGAPGGVRPGGHDSAFQRAVAGDQFDFLRARLGGG